MLKVLFFAQVRERLGCASLDVPFPEQGIDLDGLQDSLCDQGQEHWREVLGQDNMIRAINQAVVQGSPALSDGDEIAFFPPVTGG